jgi:flagellar basal body P-ring protein FlgI
MHWKQKLINKKGTLMNNNQFSIDVDNQEYQVEVTSTALEDIKILSSIDNKTVEDREVQEIIREITKGMILHGEINIRIDTVAVQEYVNELRLTR